MTYSEIITYPRNWNKAKYPAIAHIEVSANQFSKIERLLEDQTQTKVLGHDLADDDHVVIHVACTSVEIKDLVESRWA